jgi:hypothetical protein
MWLYFTNLSYDVDNDEVAEKNGNDDGGSGNRTQVAHTTMGEGHKRQQKRKKTTSQYYPTRYTVGHPSFSE